MAARTVRCESHDGSLEKSLENQPKPRSVIRSLLSGRRRRRKARRGVSNTEGISAGTVIVIIISICLRAWRHYDSVQEREALEQATKQVTANEQAALNNRFAQEDAARRQREQATTDQAFRLAMSHGGAAPAAPHAASAPVTPPPTAPAPPLIPTRQYRIRAGDTLTYKFSIETTVNGHAQVYKGVRTYSIADVRHGGTPWRRFSFTDVDDSMKVTGSGSLLVGDQGQTYDADVHLPRLFSAVGMTHIGIEDLSDPDKPSWTSKRAVDVPLIGGPSHAEQRVDAVENVKYNVEAYKTHNEPDLKHTQTLARQFELKNRVRSEELSLRVVGDGTVTFWLEKALVESLVGTAEVSINDQGATKRFEVKLAYDLVDSADSGRRNAPVASGEVVPLTVLLIDVESLSDPRQKVDALAGVSKQTPDDEHRAKVLRVVEPLLTDVNASVRGAAVGVLGVWGTADNIPQLMKLLEQRDSETRPRVIVALGQVGDKNVAKRLVSMFTDDRNDRAAAGKALAHMGPLAEEQVISLMHKHRDEEIRAAACGVLGEIGSKKAIAALKKSAGGDRNVKVSMSAKTALRKLHQ